MSRARQREMANGSRDVKNRTQKREKSNTLAELKRKGTYLVRQFSNPQGPLLNREGKSTPLALSARSWGEAVPKNSASTRRLAKKGTALLKRYHRQLKKRREGLSP